MGGSSRNRSSEGWTIVKRNLKNNGGSDSDLLALPRELRSAFLSRPRGPDGGIAGGEARRAEWRCVCGTYNWLDRHCCRNRSCRASAPQAAPSSAQHRHVSTGPRAAAGGIPAASAAKTPSSGLRSPASSAAFPPASSAASSAEGQHLPAGSVWAAHSRPRSPEETKAASEARAAALEAAVAALRDAGCEAEAAALEAPLAQARKRAAVSCLPGQRLDDCLGFIERAEARIKKVDDQVAEMARNRADLVKELEAARDRAEELRTELASSQPMDTDSGNEDGVPKYTDMNRSSLQAAIEKVEAEYRAALAAHNAELAVTKVAELQRATSALLVVSRKRQLPLESPECCGACGGIPVPGVPCPSCNAGAAETSTQPATESQLAAMAPTQRT